MLNYLPYETEVISTASRFYHSGYGSKIPTNYKAAHNGRFYRVYACCYSNSPSLYIISKGEKIFLQA